ncbi:efflux RND transporter periplasmic adaptor subunit [Pseudomonas sp. Pseusp3]|uniref:efflux RND transporter periplasmic adaptor subunit n=1 Tax=unclassified Pseudomonas TaxID=196821 RepID=UPI0039B0EA23
MTSDNKAPVIWYSSRFVWVALSISLVLAGIAIINVQAWIVSRPDGENWVSIRNESLVHKIGLAGTIEPNKTVLLTAPFEGNIQTIRVGQGQRVHQGQTLLTMDPASIESQLRDALSAQLKAQRTARELTDWENSAQVARARRTVRTAEIAVSNLQRRLGDTQRLLKRGIIARSELDDLNQQMQMHELELVAAQNELQHVLDEGAGEHRRVAEMELKNATVRYEGLQALLADQNILAPFTGVVVPARTSQLPGAISLGPLQAGARLSQGQALFGLADIEHLKIVASVSELDINQLHPGQEVEIEGDGFEGERLKGTVQVVSSLAEPSDESSGGASFSVTLSVSKLTPEQMQRVRLGMSARLAIITYRNEQAIIIPPQAIRLEGLSKVVDYREAMDRPIQQIPVSTGRSTLDGVEVFGLLPGFIRLGNQGNPL